MNRIIAVIFLFTSFLFISSDSVKAQVVINEFVSKPNPEWVEFFNKTTSEVNLGNYFFDDDADFGSDSGSSAKIILQGILQGGALCYWEMNSFLNDGGDIPTLFAVNGDLIDTYSYSSSSAGFSYSRIPDGGDWQVNVTPTKMETACQNLPTPTPSPSPSSTPTLTPTPTPTPTKTPTPIPTRSPTPVATKTPTPTETQTSLVLAENTAFFPTPTPKPENEEIVNQKERIPFIAIGLIVVGVILIGFSIFSIIKSTKKSYTLKSEKENFPLS